jgi:hypothetical protein
MRESARFGKSRVNGESAIEVMCRNGHPGSGKMIISRETNTTTGQSKESIRSKCVHVIVRGQCRLDEQWLTKLHQNNWREH